jgi:TolB-like protein
MKCLLGIFLGLSLAVALHAQSGLDSLFGDSRRVALIPPANLSGTPTAAPIVTPALRHALAARVALADSDSVSAILREYRIRNTSELSGADVEHLARDLHARYLFVGGIDQYLPGDSSAEVALSARLIDAVSGELVWLNHAAVHSDQRTRLLMLGDAPQPSGLIHRAVRELCRGFRVPPSAGNGIRAIHTPGHRADIHPCRRVAVLIMGNESDTRFAGYIITNQLLTTLHRAGFAVIDPGRVRELMLDARELTQGEMSAALLARCRNELGADFLLTGSVSDFTSTRSSAFDQPSVAFEARLIDTARGDLVWARSYARTGRDSATLFNLGYVHGLTELSFSMARQVAHDLRHLRANNLPAPEPHL